MRKKIGTMVLFFLLFLAMPGCLAVPAKAAGGDAGTGRGQAYAEDGGESEERAGEENENVREQMEERLLAEFDFWEIDDGLAEMFPGQRVLFSEVLSSLMAGDLEGTGQKLVEYVKDRLGYEFASNRKSVAYILLIAIMAAIFTNFSDALQSRQVSQVGFYILYMLIITMCLHSFRVAFAGMEGQVAKVVGFMRLLCPTYFLAVALSSGSSSAVMFYGLALFLIYAVEAVILHLVLPMINVYIMLEVVNYLLGGDALSEFADLLKKLVTWGLKTMFGIVIGINVVQGLLGPAIDVLKRSALTKTIEAIPGIGNTFGSITDVVLGTAVLLKNGIGMAGAAFLLLLCVVPVVQVALACLMFKVTAALVQPVSDERITGCIRSVSEGYGLMLRTFLTVAALFLLTIAVAAAATS